MTAWSRHHPVQITGGMAGSRSSEWTVPGHRPGLVEAAVLMVWTLAEALVGFAVRHPVLVSVPAALVALWWVAGFWPVAAAVTALVVLLVVWRWRLPVSFYRHVVSAWRRVRVYGHRWRPVMVTCGLATLFDDHEYLPVLRKVRSTRCVDQVLVQLMTGQCPERFEDATPELAHSFAALRCRVVADRPGRVWLEFTRTDPLTTIVPALDPPAEPDLEALPVGVREDGRPWTIRLLGSHLLIAGATGAGKGSVVWSLVRALGPALRDGSVQVWGIDPKGGMELTPAAGLFTRFAYATPEAMVETLEEAVAVMWRRAEHLRTRSRRLHTPTVEDPLIVVVVDELAALTAYNTDRGLRKRAEAALQLLLSQGRAPGVLLVASVQDPGKDVVGFRDLFPTRVALRLLEDVQVDMVLGRSARDRGAECDQIPPSLPGVGYVVLDGVREPVRVRAGHVTDADLAQMVTDYHPATSSASTVDVSVVEEP